MAKEGDLLLVHVEDSPAFFARIECISPDVKHDWYQVDLLVLQVPLVEITWILRGEYIDGVSFTMGGRKVSLEVVQAPGKRPPPEQDRLSDKDEIKELTEKGEERGKVIPLFNRG